MERRNRRVFLLCMLFLFLLILRLVNITNPPLDYSSWRQTDTDTIARNFVNYRFNIFYPQLNYDGPLPNYVQLEFQVTTFLIAILYKLFGFKAALGRIVPVVFFMGSCYYLYRVVYRESGFSTAFFTVLLYGVLPINIVYSRNIMPESAMMFFMIGAIYYFVLWIDSEKKVYYIWAAIFTALTILTKVPSALIGVPMIYLSFRKYKWGAFKKWELYIFALAALGIPYAYFSWLNGVAEEKFVSGIGGALILPNFLNAIFKNGTTKYLTEQFGFKIFTIPGAILFAVGVIMPKKRNKYFYYAWLAGAVLHVIFIDAVIHLDYYLMFITPIIAVFMGFACTRIICKRKYRYFLYTGIIIILLHSAVFWKYINNVRYDYIVYGKHVDSCTKQDDLIIAGIDSPEILYTSDRRGWRLYGELLTPENISKYINLGAKYFVPIPGNMKESMKEYLDRNFVKILFQDGYYIYKLSDLGK